MIGRGILLDRFVVEWFVVACAQLKGHALGNANFTPHLMLGLVCKRVQR